MNRDKRAMAPTRMESMIPADTSVRWFHPEPGQICVDLAGLSRAELEHLPWSDKTVDWVVANGVLEHPGDKARVWREIARVLKKGGRFVATGRSAVDPICDALRGDPEAIAEGWAAASTQQELLLQILRAGLIDVRVEEDGVPYPTRGAMLAALTVTGRKTACCCSCF